jgi:hypothetical protein
VLRGGAAKGFLVYERPLGDFVLELELKKGRSGLHLKKDGMPYGSYEK